MLFLQLTLIALLATRLTASAGHRLGLTDRPDARKHHAGIVPLTGGIAIFLALALSTLLPGVTPYTWPMMAIACLVFAVGVFDDVRHINPWLRLLIQCGAGILLASWGGIAIHKVGNL
ncbi:MAG: hypothetical protein ACRCVD_02150, partial [Halioglobus sp.]